MRNTPPHPRRLTVGSLFSGIGGIELGLHRTGGFETAYFVEYEPHARALLAQNFPGVPIHGDITTLDFSALAPVDVLAGGFPCQDISQAGKGAGLAGTKSSLWFEFLRAVREVRPRYVLVENVALLRKRGLDTVLGGLASFGYDAEWDCIPAAAIGAPHQRDRLFIIGYSNADSLRRIEEGDALPQDCNRERNDAGCEPRELRVPVAHADRAQLEGVWSARGISTEHADVDSVSVVGRPWAERVPIVPSWLPEPDVGRVADGVPARVDRLTRLGNAVVPQVAEYVGRVILSMEAERRGELT